MAAPGVLDYNNGWKYDPLKTNYKTDYFTDRPYRQRVVVTTSEDNSEYDDPNDEDPRIKVDYRIQYQNYRDGLGWVNINSPRPRTLSAYAWMKDEDGNYEWVDQGDDDMQIDYIESEIGDAEYNARRWEETKGRSNRRLNDAYKRENEANQTLNNKNVVRNQRANEVIAEANRQPTGTYKATRSYINNIQQGGAIDQARIDNYKSAFRKFYLAERITKFDNALTLKNPIGEDINTTFYLNKYKDLRDFYNTAVAEDDLDVLAPVDFSPDGFARKHYTEFGYNERRVANKEEETTQANAFRQKKPTDAEKASIKDNQLGITATQETPINERLLEDNRVRDLWEKVRKGDIAYYNTKKDELGLDYDNFLDFSTVFLSATGASEPESQEIKNQLLEDEVLVEGEETITEIEDVLNRAAGDATREQVVDFGALTTSVLEDTLAKLEEAKAQEAQFDLYQGFSDFGEVINPGESLGLSILGDSGIGGYLGFLGGPEYQENLEDSINSVFGIGNIGTVNWQNWFDEQLVEKYAKEYDDKFKELEQKRNILEAAGPNSRDFVAYVNDNENLVNDYITYVRNTPPADRLSKAEWGRQNFNSTNGSGEDTSALKKTIYNKDTGEFTDDFLADSFFETTEDVAAFLADISGGAALLADLQADDFNSLDLVPDIDSINKDIEAIDKAEYDLELDTQFGKELIEAQFARDFVNDYLKPRFDQSKSLAEFRDYLEVDPRYQTPFQTQNIIDALKGTATQRANAYMEQINGAIDQNFDADWYFDPTEGYGSGTGQAYDEKNNFQKDEVEADYQAALNGQSRNGIDWAAEMYRYGVPITYKAGTKSGYRNDIVSIDKARFARMHYEVKGLKGVTNSKGEKVLFRPAKNVADPDRIKRYIYYEVMPMLEDEAVDIGSVFGQFVTPEQFADDVIDAYDLTDQEVFDEVLAKYGLDAVANVEELRTQLIEVIASNDALAIRKGIEEINEQGLRPDQKKLGVEYIEREEDYEPNIKGNTELYKIFQAAGFQGTEESFYQEFLPDEDPSELRELEDALQGMAFEREDYSDPLQMLSSVDRYFPEFETDLEEPIELGQRDSDKFTAQYRDAYKPENVFTFDESKTGTDYSDYGSQFDTRYKDYGNKKSRSGKRFLDQFTSSFY